MSQGIPSRPGSPAASHMLWFFVFPILALIGFATWKLTTGLLHPENLTLSARLARLESAVNAGERWKEAYGVTQEIHKKKQSGEWATAPLEEKQAVYSTFSHVLKSNDSDARVARYLLVTLGQLGEKNSLPILESFQTNKDPELVFYSVWAYAQTILATKDWTAVSDEASDRLVSLMNTSNDLELRKIICTFLAQGPMKRKSEKDALLAQLNLADHDLRWNAAIALLPTGVATDRAEAVLMEMLNPSALQKAGLKRMSDLKQALLVLRSTIEKTKNEKLRTRARAFINEVPAETPEGKAVREGLAGL